MGVKSLDFNIVIFDSTCEEGDIEVDSRLEEI